MPWIESRSLSPADRVVVDWRISEYELVDDEEVSHEDKLYQRPQSKSVVAILYTSLFISNTDSKKRNNKR